MENSYINVSEWDYVSRKPREGCYSTSSTQLLVIPCVRITYRQHDQIQTFPPIMITNGHKMHKCFKLDCDKLSLGDSSSYDLVLGMIAHMNLPFSIDNHKLNWRVEVRGENPPWTPLQNQDDLVKKILDVASCFCNKKEEEEEEDKSYRIMRLKIERVVILSKDELEAKIKDSEEKEYLHHFQEWISMIIDYQVSIETNLTLFEWMIKIEISLWEMKKTVSKTSIERSAKRAYCETEERILMGLKPASLSSIKALERVEIMDLDSVRDCSICGEEIMVGDFTGRMACLHMFHICCIEKWLSLNHVCPLCRYELPNRL
ncbi:hypothetical protein ACFE04_027783 [Oxalis oulophora]